MQDMEKQWLFTQQIILAKRVCLPFTSVIPLGMTFCVNCSLVHDCIVRVPDQ